MTSDIKIIKIEAADEFYEMDVECSGVSRPVRILTTQFHDYWSKEIRLNHGYPFSENCPPFDIKNTKDFQLLNADSEAAKEFREALKKVLQSSVSANKNPVYVTCLRFDNAKPPLDGVVETAHNPYENLFVNEKAYSSNDAVGNCWMKELLPLREIENQ